MEQPKDEELMLRYQQGESAMMSELVMRYKNPVYHFACRLCGNSAEAEDIAQEVFLRLHQVKSQYRPVGKFSTWIFGIAHNIAVSRLRRSKWWVAWPCKNSESEELVDFESADPSPKCIAEVNEVSSIVQKDINSLPFLQREALILREYEKLDYLEIAKILKKSLGTVKTLIFRARQNLKIKLLAVNEELKGE